MTKTTSKKTAKAPTPSKATVASNLERQRTYRLKHDKPMSINPKMAAARTAIVLATWTPAHIKSVMALLSKRPTK